MLWKLYDWKGREISSTLEERLFSKEESSKERVKFYQSYFEQIGKPLGFNEFQGDVFGRVTKEFKQQRIFEDIFSSYADFFHAFFIQPYGFSYSYEDHKHVFKDQMDSNATNDKERKITNFVRRINLPILFHLALESYKKKQEELSAYQEELQKEKVLIYYRKEWFQKSLEGTLKPELNTNFWNNLFSDFEDCLFIHYDQEEQKVTFQDYWFASLLHQLHPKIYYLNFVAGEDKESRKLKKAYSRPLVRVILMETDSSNMPLIVEGVLGSSLEKIKVKSGGFGNIKEFIDYSIWKFFNKRFKTVNPESELLYFPFHQPRPNKAYSQFDDYIKKKYRTSCSSNQGLHLNVPSDEELFFSIYNRRI